jgi:hypothetical protein
MDEKLNLQVQKQDVLYNTANKNYLDDHDGGDDADEHVPLVIMKSINNTASSSSVKPKMPRPIVCPNSLNTQFQCQWT